MIKKHEREAGPWLYFSSLPISIASPSIYLGPAVRIIVRQYVFCLVLDERGLVTSLITPSVVERPHS
jgi:hypothetical protein